MSERKLLNEENKFTISFQFKNDNNKVIIETLNYTHCQSQLIIINFIEIHIIVKISNKTSFFASWKFMVKETQFRKLKLYSSFSLPIYLIKLFDMMSSVTSHALDLLCERAQNIFDRERFGSCKRESS